MSYNIKKISENDIPNIINIIDNIFPYTDFNEESILKKIRSKNFLLLKIVEKNFLKGFCEVEFFFKKKEARLNAIFVVDSFRKKGIATFLLKKIIIDVKKKDLENFFLLVKKDNFVAKKLYSKVGFCFEKDYFKKIDNSLVEIWSLKNF